MLFKFSIVILSLSCFVSALNELSAKEKRCDLTPPPVAKNIDAKWAASIETNYITLVSRMHLYRTAAEILETPYEDIQEDKMYYESCFRVKFSASPFYTGYHGKKAPFDIISSSNGITKFRLPYLQTELTGYVTLTDNKTFQFLYICWGDGEASWIVLSPQKSLDKATEKKIYEHAKSLGFKENNFVRMRMETCNEGKNRDEL